MTTDKLIAGTEARLLEIPPEPRKYVADLIAALRASEEANATLRKQLAESERKAARLGRMAFAVAEGTSLEDSLCAEAAQLRARIAELEAERDRLREEVDMLAEMASVQRCDSCKTWQDNTEFCDETGYAFCCDCYDAWEWECSGDRCTYRVPDPAEWNNECPQCGEAFERRITPQPEPTNADE